MSFWRAHRLDQRRVHLRESEPRGSRRWGAVVFRNGLMACLGWAVVAPLGLGCERDKTAQKPAASAAEKPTLRLYALAGAAGAIEPCGCVKDMLGGIDHAAAFVAAESKTYPHSLVVGAGPMFFENPTVEESKAKQALFKAEAMAASLRDLGLVAWAPGANDWAMGVPQFGALVQGSGALPLAGNLDDKAGPVVATHLVERGGLKVGLFGISVPDAPSAKLEFEVAEASLAAAAGVKKLRESGADIVVGLVAAQRGKALRLIEQVSDVEIAVLGKSFDQGEANDKPFAPEMIGRTLVTQAPNHLQGVSVVDLIVREGGYVFSDGSGLEGQARRVSLEGRIDELQRRIASWKAGGQVKKSDIQEREEELARLKQELEGSPVAEPPKKGSYFLYDLVEVREGQGEDGRVASRLKAYYRKVNEHNKEAFADRKPRPVGEGESSYVGVEACSSCHLEERAVWDKTRHSGAYETLTSGHKEFNLDCVSCHVTGYEKPGGSTVTHVEQLTDVQCEVCHGPGSQHVANPADLSLIRKVPDRDLCASACHHPPHVGPEWTVETAWPLILGPGHGN